MSWTSTGLSDASDVGRGAVSRVAVGRAVDVDVDVGIGFGVRVGGGIRVDGPAATRSCPGSVIGSVARADTTAGALSVREGRGRGGADGRAANGVCVATCSDLSMGCVAPCIASGSALATERVGVTAARGISGGFGDEARGGANRVGGEGECNDEGVGTAFAADWMGTGPEPEPP